MTTGEGVRGFTLTELLVALAILGVIATFTIPKVLQSQQDGRNKAIAKEAAGMLSAAFQNYRLNNTLTAGFFSGQLTPYLNFVKYDTSGTMMDDNYGQGSWACDASNPCILLHNGAAVHFENGCAILGTTRLHAVQIEVDPDGRMTDNTTNGPGKAVQFFLYADGGIRSWGNILPNTHDACAGPDMNPGPSLDPPWFSWD